MTVVDGKGNHGVEDIDLARRLANARAVGVVIAVIWAALGLYLAAVGDRPVIVALELGIAALALLARLGTRRNLAAASIALVVLPLLDNVGTTMARGHPRLSLFASTLSPMFAGLLFGPRGVAFAFAAALTTMAVCHVMGTEPLTPIPAEQIMIVAVALTCFSLTGGALASSSTARALGLARRQQQDLAEGETRQRKRMLQAQEKERGAIARELHDDFGQLLTAVRLTLDAGHTAEAIGQVDEALTRMRNLALSLRPAALDDLGLHESLRSFVARHSGRAGFEVDLVLGGAAARLPEPIETACFRLVQEALTNVARHAAARTVRIRLDTSENVVELSIVDDGRGFDVDAARARAAAGQSLGLIGMEERVALAGGQLDVTSSAGQGTALRARFELRGPA